MFCTFFIYSTNFNRIYHQSIKIVKQNIHDKMLHSINFK